MGASAAEIDFGNEAEADGGARTPGTGIRIGLDEELQLRVRDGTLACTGADRRGAGAGGHRGVFWCASVEP